MARAPGANAMASWSFLTNHALVLMHVGQRPESTGLEIAQAVGITERATRSIVGDLQTAGYVEREKVGRRNRYGVDIHRPMVRIGERELTVGQVLELVLGRETLRELSGEDRPLPPDRVASHAGRSEPNAYPTVGALADGPLVPGGERSG